MCSWESYLLVMCVVVHISLYKKGKEYKNKNNAPFLNHAGRTNRIAMAPKSPVQQRRPAFKTLIPYNATQNDQNRYLCEQDVLHVTPHPRNKTAYTPQHPTLPSHQPAQPCYRQSGTTPPLAVRTRRSVRCQSYPCAQSQTTECTAARS
jgi:hypothetical protein